MKNLFVLVLLAITLGCNCARNSTHSTKETRNGIIFRRACSIKRTGRTSAKNNWKSPSISTATIKNTATRTGNLTRRTITKSALRKTRTKARPRTTKINRWAATPARSAFPAAILIFVWTACFRFAAGVDKLRRNVRRRMKSRRTACENT